MSLWMVINLELFPFPLHNQAFISIMELDVKLSFLIKSNLLLHFYNSYNFSAKKRFILGNNTCVTLYKGRGRLQYSETISLLIFHSHCTILSFMEKSIIRYVLLFYSQQCAWFAISVADCVSLSAGFQMHVSSISYCSADCIPVPLLHRAVHDSMELTLYFPMTRHPLIHNRNRQHYIPSINLSPRSCENNSAL